MSLDLDDETALPEPVVETNRNELLLLVRAILPILKSPASPDRLVNVAVDQLAKIEIAKNELPGAPALALAINQARLVTADMKAKQLSVHANTNILLRGRRHAMVSALGGFPAHEIALQGKLAHIDRNLGFAQQLFCLNEHERAMLLFSMACGLCASLDRLLDLTLETMDTVAPAVSVLLDIPQEQALEMTSPESTLAQSGLVTFPRAANWYTEAVGLTGLFKEILARPMESVDALRAALVGSRLTTTLTLADFPHVEGEAQTIQRVLKKAKADRLTGVNILLHGAVGVGKTSIASAIADDLGLYPLGEATTDGKEPERDERMQALLIAQQTLRGQPDAIALVDEAEDVLVPFRRGKIYINRLLETNPVPVIYIVNDVSDLSDAVKRRMTYVLELKAPPNMVRETIVRRVLDDQGLVLSDADVSRVAALGTCAPAIISNAARAAVLSDGGAEVLLSAAKNMLQVIDGKRPQPVETPPQFDPRFSCADVDLERLADQLVAAPSRHWNLLMLGKPGTGKSAMARYVAERLGMPVLQVAAHQILSPYVGQSETNLARFFAQAKEDGSFLLFDEIDSFAFNRNMAVRSFELSLTNALLEQLQDHKLPMACCTNAMASHDRLDPALLRRFTFKVNFNYLTAPKARGLFAHVFGVAAPAELDNLTALTPGDYDVVRRKASILGQVQCPSALVDLLAQECAAKGDMSAPLGFGFAVGTC